MSETNTPIAVGIHREMREADYHALDLCSASRLRTLHASTEAHLRHEIETGGDETAAMRAGTALHTLLVFGEAGLMDRFAIGGPINEKTGRTFGPETLTFKQWEQDQGKPVISTEIAERCRAMVAAVNASRAASGLMRLCGDRELTLVADLHGQRCKGRIDFYGREYGIILDVKTTSKLAGREDFERSIANFGYGIQATMYEHLAMACDMRTGTFAFVVVETEPPHCVATYVMRQEVVLAYEQLLPLLIERYGRCKATGEWPGWPDRVQEIGVPVWLKTQLEREINAVEVALA